MSYNPFSLENKTILVTGASSGIGRATAIECSKLGAKLILVARNEERLKETLSLLEGENHKCIIADLSVIEDIDKLVAELPEINGLVNNAGLGTSLLVKFIKEKELDRILKVNLIAPILLTQKVVKYKKIVKNSSIVFVSSIAGSLGACTFGQSIYGTSKAGIRGFMRYAALELAQKNIRCNAVMPGMTNTPFISGGAISNEQLEIDRQNYPLKRYGEPEEIAHGIIYFLSDASKWTTGTTLTIDGGFTLL